MLFRSDVTNLGSGAVKVAMNSTFKTWQVDGQTDLVASGLDTIEFVAGAGIQITTDPTSTPKSITFASTQQGAQGVQGIQGYGVGLALVNYGTYSYVVNGSTNTFTVEPNITLDNTIVTVNGITQTPTTDYTITGSVVTLLDTPEANGTVVIKVLGGLEGIQGTTGVQGTQGTQGTQGVS